LFDSRNANRKKNAKVREKDRADRQRLLTERDEESTVELRSPHPLFTHSDTLIDSPEARCFALRQPNVQVSAFHDHESTRARAGG
jgi:hypothetical protein